MAENTMVTFGCHGNALYYFWNWTCDLNWSMVRTLTNHIWFILSHEKWNGTWVGHHTIYSIYLPDKGECGSHADVYMPWQRHSLVYQLRIRSQSTTGTSLDCEEFAGRRCVALPILVQKVEGPSLSLAGPPGLAVILWDLDSDRRAKTETELFLYSTLSLTRILGY